MMGRIEQVLRDKPGSVHVLLFLLVILHATSIWLFVPEATTWWDFSNVGHHRADWIPVYAAMVAAAAIFSGFGGVVSTSLLTASSFSFVKLRVRARQPVRVNVIALNTSAVLAVFMAIGAAAFEAGGISLWASFLAEYSLLLMGAYPRFVDMGVVYATSASVAV